MDIRKDTMNQNTYELIKIMINAGKDVTIFHNEFDKIGHFSINKILAIDDKSYQVQYQDEKTNRIVVSVYYEVGDKITWKAYPSF